MSNIEDLDSCPKCGQSWVDKEIPVEDRKHYDDSSHFSLLVGIETEDYDGVSAWMCPFCKKKWDRFENNNKR